MNGVGRMHRCRICPRAAVLLATWLLGPQALADVRELPVPTATIYPNDIITGSLLAERWFRVTSTSVAGFATDRTGLIGKQARRRLVAGKPVPLSALGTPVAVRRGAIVSAGYSEPGFSISVSLVAMQDGTAGDVITAKNAATGALVRAVVQSDGSLLVAGE